MNRENQIIEIKECIDNVYGADCAYYDVDGFAIANEIYSKGYRKQIEGEWVRDNENKPYICSNCRRFMTFQNLNFCPECGAKMKGGAE